MHSVFLPHCSNDDDNVGSLWTKTSWNTVVLDEEDSPPFLNVSDAGVPVGLAAYEER